MKIEIEKLESGYIVTKTEEGYLSKIALSNIDALNSDITGVTEHILDLYGNMHLSKKQFATINIDITYSDKTI